MSILKLDEQVTNKREYKHVVCYTVKKGKIIIAIAPKVDIESIDANLLNYQQIRNEDIEDLQETGGIHVTTSDTVTGITLNMKKIAKTLGLTTKFINVSSDPDLLVVSTLMSYYTK
jgi:hypothetical protein